jgi:hypothetical protein
VVDQPSVIIDKDKHVRPLASAVQFSFRPFHVADRNDATGHDHPERADAADADAAELGAVRRSAAFAIGVGVAQRDRAAWAGKTADRVAERAVDSIGDGERTDVVVARRNRGGRA